METAGLVAHWSTAGVLVLAGAELAEVLCCLWDGVAEEVHFYAAHGFACEAGQYAR